MSLQFLQDKTSSAHDDSIWGLSWTGKNEIVSTSADGGLRVWDPTTPSQPKLKHHLRSHPLGITSLSVNPEGTRALTVSVEGTVVLSDLEKGVRVGKKLSFQEEVGSEGIVLPAWSASLHPSSTSYATTGQNARIAFYPISPSDGDAIMVGDDEKTEEAGVLGGEAVKVLETGRGRFGMNLCYSPDGRLLALSSETGHITIIDVETQTIVANHPSHTLCSRTLSWSPDSQWLFSGADDRRIVLHDIRAGSTSGGSGRGSAAVAELTGHTSWVLSLSASPDSRLLVSGGADSTVKIWDVGQRTCVSSTTTSSQVWAVDWQPLVADMTNVGKAFVSGGDDEKVTVWKAAGSA